MSDDHVTDDRPIPPANVWVLSDGRSGHLGTTRGILLSLARLRPLNEHWIELRMRLGAARLVMHYWLHGFGWPAPRLLRKACYHIGSLPAAKPDLILSTGGTTAYMNASFAREHRCPNLFAGTLRGLRPSFFTAVIVPFPLDGVSNSIELEYLPSTFDPAKAAQAGRDYRVERNLSDERLWTMVIGGDGAGYRFTDADWRQLAQAMNHLTDAHHVRWLLTSSRRTGVHAETILRDAIDPAILADAVWWSQEPRKVMMPFLGAAECVYCTEDSSSMLTESMLAGKPTRSLRPQISKPVKIQQMLLDRHVGSKRLERVAIADLCQQGRLAGHMEFNLITQGMGQILAEKLVSYLPSSWRSVQG